MKTIQTSMAPKAIGPYSQAICIDSRLYTSGQIAIEPKTGVMVQSSFRAEVLQVLSNLKGVLEASGCHFSDVIKTTIYLTDLGQFNELNDLYAEAMGDHRPARSTVQVSALPKGATVEIDCIARMRQA